MAYPLPSGKSVKFLNDQTTYPGNQLEPEFGGERCFGILANMDFIFDRRFNNDYNGKKANL